MTTLFATASLYCACMGFYHANERRTMFDALKSSKSKRHLLHALSWALAILSLIMFAQISGWERGIPFWLAVFTLTGLASLMISALWARLHLKTGLVALVVMVSSALALLVGGGV